MNRWKSAFWIAVAALIVTNLYWFYVAVDSGVSYSYLTDSYNEERRITADLGALIVHGSKNNSKKDVMHLLRQAKPNAFIVDEGDVVIYEQISFRFHENRLVEVGGAR